MNSEAKLLNPASGAAAIVQEAVMKAPAERIFQALIDPGERVKWWGAEGRFQATQLESELRPGGRWTMRGVGIGGKPFTVSGEYRQVERARLLVFTWLPDWQEDATETLVRVDLEEENGATKVRLTHSGLKNENDRANHRGWPQVLSWLQAYVERVGAQSE